MRRLKLAALSVALAFPGCTDSTRARTANHGDATSADAARAETARPDAGGGCAARCAGRCVATRCLTTLAEAPRPTRLALDATNAYFTACDAGGSVRRVPLDGGAVVELAHGAGCPADLALSADAAYVAGLDGGGVSRLALTGGAPTTIVAETSPIAGIAVDGSAIYATTTSGVLKAPLSDGAFRPLATVTGQRAATRPVLDEQNVYFADPELGAIYRVSKDGGDVTTLASGLGGVEAIAIADQALYAGAGYVVVKIPTAGGAPVTVGTAAGAEVLALAVDDSGVYFTSSGVVWTLPLGGGTPLALASDDGDLDAIAANDADLVWTAAPACDAADCSGRIERLSPK